MIRVQHEGSVILQDYLGRRFDAYVITTVKVPEDADKGPEADILRQQQVVGLERAVKAWIEYQAKTEWPDLRFTWQGQAYNSDPVDGRILHIGYERHYDPHLGIEAIAWCDDAVRA